MSKTLNTNVKYKDKTYHVQTEVYKDKVVICVFYNGMVIFKRNEDFRDYKTTLKWHKEIEDKIKSGQLVKND